MQSYLAGQNTEHALVQIHNGIVAALVGVHHGICVQANNQIVTQFLSLFQKVQVTHMEEIEGASHINLQIPTIMNYTLYTYNEG